MIPTVQCSICGEPVVLELPPDADSWDALTLQIMGRLSRMAHHTECLERRERENAAVIMAKRAGDLKNLIPPLFQDTDPSRLNSPACVSALKWKYGPQGMVLWGESRRMKTRTAYEILKREHLAGRACLALTHVEWCMSYDSAYRENQKVMDNWLRLVRTVDLLLIDDFGVPTMGYGDSNRATRGTEALYQTFDHRCTHKLPTLFTCHFGVNHYANQLGATGNALVQRLKEFCKPIHFTKEP